MRSSAGVNWSVFRMLLAMPALLAVLVVAAAADSGGLSDEQKESFLLNAEIGDCKRLSVGITGSQKCSLRSGDLTHDAHVQTIDEHKTSFQTASGTELNFRDSFRYNIAAYRLDRMIHLNMVPVSVFRKVKGEEASVTWWVDDVMMMEKERWQKSIEPPDKWAWNDQMYQARIFNNLVYNTDPNLGNLLITKDWQLHLIDFTRAFRLYKKLRDPKELVVIDQRVMAGLKELNAAALQARMGDLITKSEIKGLLDRRDIILATFDKLVASQGEPAVVCRRAGH